MNRNKKLCLALLFASVAGAFRDTAGLEVTDVTWDPGHNSYRVLGVLTNRSPRSATSVVLVAQVRDGADAVMGMNPLINVLDIPSSGSKPFEAFVPATRTSSEAHVSVKPTVVRWEGGSG